MFGFRGSAGVEEDKKHMNNVAPGWMHVGDNRLGRVAWSTIYAAFNLHFTEGLRDDVSNVNRHWTSIWIPWWNGWPTYRKRVKTRLVRDEVGLYEFTIKMMPFEVDSDQLIELAAKQKLWRVVHDYIETGDWAKSGQGSKHFSGSIVQQTEHGLIGLSKARKWGSRAYHGRLRAWSCWEIVLDFKFGVMTDGGT